MSWKWWEMMQWIHSSDSVVCSRHQRYISLYDLWTWYSFFVNNSFSFFFEEFMLIWEIQELEHFLRHTIFAKLMNIKTDLNNIAKTLYIVLFLSIYLYTEFHFCNFVNEEFYNISWHFLTSSVYSTTTWCFNYYNNWYCKRYIT